MGDVTGRVGDDLIGIHGAARPLDQTTHPLSTLLDHTLMKTIDDLIAVVTLGVPARHQALSVYPLTCEGSQLTCNAVDEHSTQKGRHDRSGTARTEICGSILEDRLARVRPSERVLRSSSVGTDGPGGVLHAKAVVADVEVVFVTSANLTEAALDRNIEVGLLVRDRALALSVSSHFYGLIDRGLLHPLPMV
jgi:phosphatidylserine/phosphatidylglycerophosphate/cardiolipin synthase-like enzyme